MKIAVCVKYVPVVARMRFDYERKTIIREGVPSEVNPFDVLALVRAVQMKRGQHDEVVAVCMGPPNAKEGLVQCLALGADRAVLLTDRALAGSDTLATARALSLVLQREQPELIICGRNSADAETGQVGPELAELLGIPHISQVRKLDLRVETNTIVAERVTDEGYQVMECPLPALVCVTEGIAPETFPNRQQVEEAKTKPIQELTAAQLSSDASLFGAAGSPTWVESIRLVEPNRLGMVITQDDPQAAAQQVAGLLRERLAALAPGEAGATHVSSLPRRYPNQRERSIWVVAETTGQGLRQVTLEMLGKARQLTAFTRSEVVAVLLGSATPSLTGELAAGGADRVLVLDHRALGPVMSRAVAQTLASAVQAARPYAVLFAATPDGRDLASRISARLGLGLTGDAIDLEINDQGQLVQLKPALGGNVVAPILSKTLPNMVTLRPGLLTPADSERGAKAAVETIPALPFRGADVRMLEEHHQEDLGAIALAQAQVVLGVGKGIGGPENLPQVQALAQSLGATLCATRDVVHLGWLPHQVQVGISGRSIAPRVYLAVGIRGAFNHTVGVQKAGVIIAINTNARHPIFKTADYGIVGDWQKYLPPLVAALKVVLGNP
ncbi:MAG: electron transfer flavoprotein alpha/ beta subunit [Dehalococcoidia bacterium]|nr:electron transfer flavoprotein alpha/ beta subunit [Dehalococcoidia bacterium]MSQ17707.1 electron transfer flavoprotein alpha/ beta subunit [Dehalococcoidia bacterium]